MLQRSKRKLRTGAIKRKEKEKERKSKKIYLKKQNEEGESAEEKGGVIYRERQYDSCNFPPRPAK